VRVWTPVARAELVIDQFPEASARAEPSAVVPLVSKRVTVAPTSAPLPVNAGVVTLVMLSIGGEPGRVGAVRPGADGAAAAVSMVTLRLAEATLVLPAMSVCLAVRVCAPPARAELVIDQAPVPLATPVPSAVAPSVS